MKETDDPKDFINLKSDLDEKRLDIKKVDEEIKKVVLNSYLDSDN